MPKTILYGGQRAPFGDDTIDTVTNQGVPTGLVQGPPASCSILSWDIKDLPQLGEDQGFVLVYVDDILVVARSAEAWLEIENAVISHLRDCLAGPLELVTSQVDPGTSFDFLGYELGFCVRTEKAVACLSHRTHERLARNLEELSTVERDLGLCCPLISTSYLRAAISGQPMAADADEWEQVYLSNLIDFGLT